MTLVDAVYPAFLIAILSLVIKPDNAMNESRALDRHQQGAGDVRLVNNEDERRVDIFIDDSLFTSYIYLENLEKPVLYPVMTANGTPVTRGFPLEPRPGESTDHPHHIGLWFNYGNVNGLDFWNNSSDVPAEEKHNYGYIKHHSIDNLSSGAGSGELEVTLYWMNYEDEVLIRENTRFIFNGLGQKRTIERVTTLTAVDGDVSMEDNKEGVLGMRMAKELEHPDEHSDATGIYTSSNGLTGNDVWGTRGRWVALSGLIGQMPVTVAMLDHQQNPGFPTYWHARGYGLFAANPLGQRELSGGRDELNLVLEADQPVTFRYRVLILSGSGRDIGEIEDEWNLFNNN